MKRVITSIVTMVAVGAVAVSGTLALFSDTEIIEGNTFAAGSLDLVLNSPVSLPFNVQGIMPGDSDEGKVTLKNTGSLPGTLDIRITNLVQDENGCLEPEIEAGDPCDAGDLNLALRMAMFLDVNGDGNYNQADGDIELEYSGNTNTTSGLQLAKVSDFVGNDWSNLLITKHNFYLDPDEEVDLIIKYEFLVDSYQKPDAIFMSDTLTFDIEATLNQQQ